MTPEYKLCLLKRPTAQFKHCVGLTHVHCISPVLSRKCHKALLCLRKWHRADIGSCIGPVAPGMMAGKPPMCWLSSASIGGFLGSGEGGTERSEGIPAGGMAWGGRKSQDPAVATPQPCSPNPGRCRLTGLEPAKHQVQIQGALSAWLEAYIPLAQWWAAAASQLVLGWPDPAQVRIAPKTYKHMFKHMFIKHPCLCMHFQINVENFGFDFAWIYILRHIYTEIIHKLVVGFKPPGLKNGNNDLWLLDPQ